MNYNRNNKFGGRNDSGGRGFGNRNSITMHKTKCTECNSECEVPFQPTGNKPVLCNNCFKAKGNVGSKRYGGERDSGRFRFEDKQLPPSVCNNEECKKQFEQLDKKLDMILERLKTKPDASKPKKEKAVPKTKKAAI